MSIAIILLLVSSCKPIIDSLREMDTRQYYVSIVDKSSGFIKVRHSHLNTFSTDEWFTADMPGNYKSAKGVSMASDNFPTTMMAYVNQSGKTDLVWGVFGYESERTSATSDIVSNNPPAIARTTNGWVIAVTNAGNIVDVHQYNSDTEEFDIATNTPVSGVNNNNVEGMPGIASRNMTELVLCWKRAGNIQFVTGTFNESSNAIVWGDAATLSLPNEVEGQLYSSIVSNVAITASPTKFYLAFTRRTISSGSDDALNRDDLFIYQSSNGLDWSFMDLAALVKLDAHVSIAAAADDNFLVTVNGMLDPTNPKLGVLWFHNDSWTALDPEKVLGPFDLKPYCTVGLTYGGHPSLD